ncbi:MAG: NAD(P)-dependent oxidoreductase [Candidatus Sulfotelmatobacter sp.]|jgi:UDP-glucose 4-epimerase
MKVLLTGASSFTGFWFVRTLAERGHQVAVTFQGARNAYDGARARRIENLPSAVECLWESPMRSAKLREFVASEGGWDLLCLHAAYVTNYRSFDFDYLQAVKNNTDGLPTLLETMGTRGLSRVIATGSVFEAEEGAGEEPRRAFSPYGLSKTLTWKVQQYRAALANVTLGKFVIPNPFGPFEEPRFTAYLMKSWYAGQTAEVRTPDYIRDNIHVSQLAAHYADFAEEASCAGHKCAPMGYAESQGAFTLRFAAEMRQRLRIPCEVSVGKQSDFTEPLMRVNTQLLPLPKERWNETGAWDQLASYYESEFGGTKSAG